MSLFIVTGAAGAIGGHVVRHLQGGGHTVIGVGHGASSDALPPNSWINGDIVSANLDALSGAHGKPDAVIHLAGSSSVGPSLIAPAEDFFRTVSATVNLLEWIRLRAPDAAVVLASSAAVYGNAGSTPIPDHAPCTPVSPYGAHKAMMEMVAASWAKNFGLKIASVRLFSIYGPGLEKQLVWEVLNRLAEGGRQFLLGGTGAETRDWVHIDDAARLLISAIDQASNTAPVFNGCTGRALSVADTIRALAKGRGADVELVFNGTNRPGDPIHLVGVPSALLRTKIDPIDGLQDFSAAFSRR